MITSIVYLPVVGLSVTLNDLVYPLNVFEVETNYDTRSFKKASAPGEWPVYSYPGAMTVHAEGAIIGSTSSDYVTKRMTLLDAIIPPIQTLTTRKHGVLRIQMDGWTETADADVIVTAQQAPLRALNPSISEFMVTWKSFLPYFVGTSTSTKYQLG